MQHGTKLRIHERIRVGTFYYVCWRFVVVFAVVVAHVTYICLCVGGGGVQITELQLRR